jgi:hypothetical protein
MVFLYARIRCMPLATGYEGLTSHMPCRPVCIGRDYDLRMLSAVRCGIVGA